MSFHQTPSAHRTALSLRDTTNDSRGCVVNVHVPSRHHRPWRPTAQRLGPKGSVRVLSVSVIRRFENVLRRLAAGDLLYKRGILTLSVQKGSLHPQGYAGGKPAGGCRHHLAANELAALRPHRGVCRGIHAKPRSRLRRAHDRC